MIKRNYDSIRQFFSYNFITSASYNRMKSYMYDHETVTLSADKSARNEDNYTGEFTNKDMEAALRTGLQELCWDYGWKVIPVYGGYQGTEDKSAGTNENSYMVINMNDNSDFRNIMNDFMREFDSNFGIDFKQESIMYSPALGRETVDEEGNIWRSLKGKGTWDYPSTPNAAPFELGEFRDKAKGVDRNDNGDADGYFYTKPRRYKSHSFVFGDDYVSDR